MERQNIRQRFSELSRIYSWPIGRHICLGANDPQATMYRLVRRNTTGVRQVSKRFIVAS